ncbi:hypothetical protein [Pseudoroseicyclus sp. CXY001]|uniref:hypothetical protein n=1 Tax=Pseudoroseicyclus sp. CXY001 TaxID=3242492 RepID=UPI003570D5D9
MARRLTRALGFVALINYLGLIAIGALVLGPAGAAPPDLMVTGYGVAEIEGYLAGLAGVTDIWPLAVALLDTIFPICLGLFLALLAFRWNRGALAWAAALAALAYMGADLGENWLIRAFAAGAPVTEPAVRFTAQVTMAKFALLAVAVLLLAVSGRRGRARARAN